MNPVLWYGLSTKTFMRCAPSMDREVHWTEYGMTRHIHMGVRQRAVIIHRLVRYSACNKHKAVLQIMAPYILTAENLYAGSICH